MTEPTQKSLEKADKCVPDTAIKHPDIRRMVRRRVALALDAARQSEWSDIETMPDNDRSVFFGNWRNGQVWRSTAYRDRARLFSATHWKYDDMPVPPSRPQP